MKIIIMMAALTTFLFNSAQACTIEYHLKACVEVVKLKDTTQVIEVDGKPSSDFTTKVMWGSYLKITYNKAITDAVNATLVVTGNDGKVVKRPVDVTTKVIDDGSKIKDGVGALTKELILIK